MTTWQSCDCYLLPVNGPFLCLISFTYGFAPLSFFSLFFYFPVYFSILAFSSFFAFFLFHSLLLFFLFIGKASLEPADYPRVLGYKKAPTDQTTAFKVICLSGLHVSGFAYDTSKNMTCNRICPCDAFSYSKQRRIGSPVSELFA